VTPVRVACLLLAGAAGSWGELRTTDLRFDQPQRSPMTKHNVVGFAFDLSPGEHPLTAAAAGRYTASDSFTLVGGDPDYGTLLFWADAETDPYLDLHSVEEEPGFA
jgi:hypothetical protein